MSILKTKDKKEKASPSKEAESNGNAGCGSEDPGFDLYIDPGNADERVIIEILDALSSLSEDLSGTPVEFERVDRRREGS